MGKQTIYRWYDSKADLLLDAYLARCTEVLPPMVAGGEPMLNFRNYMRRLVEYLAEPMMEGASRALLAEAQFERPFRERFGEIVMKRRQEIARAFVISAMHKKQIRDDVDPDMVLDLIMSPIFQRYYTTVTPPDTAYVDKVFDTVLAGISVKAAAPAKIAAE